MSPKTRRRARRSESQRGAGRTFRLQKLLADAGIGSRRAAERLIREGRVTVGGRVVTQLGTRADPLRDRICVDGRRVGRPRRRIYYLLHKPRGYITTTRDPRAKRTAMELVPGGERLFPVGRLDAQSEGLLLVTNDGPLAQVLMHPSFRIPRGYRVSVQGRVRAATLRTLARGVELEGRMLVPSSVRLLEAGEARSVLELELLEGRRHQIRRLLRAVGHPVRRLVRTSYGPLRLRGLRVGASRRLTPSERRALEALAREPAAERQPER